MAKQVKKLSRIEKRVNGNKKKICNVCFIRKTFILCDIMVQDRGGANETLKRDDLKLLVIII